jgi:hypothetical protein
MEYGNKIKRRKLVSLCVLGMVFFMLFSLVPFTSVVPADAAFSSITITEVTPTELSPGETREVIVAVKNNGGADARDIKLSFQGTEIVSLVGSTVAQINTLNSWTSKEVKITVHVKEEAPTGTYSIPITCNWYEPTTKTVVVGYKTVTTGTPPNTVTETIPQTETQYDVPEPRSTQLGISFNIKGRAVMNVGAVTTNPTDIRPGDENVEIRAVIENSGEAAAKDVEARLICSEGFKPSWSGTDRSYIGRLNSGDSKEAIFHIDLADSIESNTYSIPLQIRYKDTKGGEYEVMRSVEILVKPKPDFEIVSFHTEPANISAGDTGVKLHVRIRNVGSEKAESISVRSTGEAEVPFDFDVKSDYVGNLKSGEEWTAVLKFDVDKDASLKTYQQGIEIRCTGDRDLGDDNVYLFDRMIPISVSSSSSGRFSIPGFEALFALFALALVVVLLGRNREGV